MPLLDVQTFFLSRSFLLEEWKQLMLRLEPELAARIPEPLIIPNQHLEAWGAWHGGKDQVIELKASLLLEHPWSSVVEVLKHETAHQVVEALYGTGAVPPHGREFREVCQRLGANPLASARTAPPDLDIFDQDNLQDSATAQLFGKVRKLLSLANSSDPHEAEAALAKARLLMSKHGITQLPGESPEQELSLFSPNLPSSWPKIITSLLGKLLEDFFQVRMLYTRAPNLRTGKTGLAMTLCGTRQDLRLAGYACDCLVNFLQNSWNHHKDQCLRRDVFYRDSDFTAFAYGALTQISSSLQRQEEAPDAPSLAITPAKQQRLEEFLNWKFPFLKKQASRSVRLSSNHLSAGRQAGADFQLHPGLESKTGKNPHLLP